MADAPSRGGTTGNWLSGPYAVAVSFGNPNGGIQRGTGADWFGPQNPMTPVAPPEVAGRQWDFPVGMNLATTPRTFTPIGFHTLRTIADGWDILRLIIETRKDQLQRMNWQIKAKNPKQQDALSAKIKIATDFFQKPDGLNDWPDWLRMICEDLFVIDAPSIYCQRTRGGALYGLHPIDGATIIPRIDDWGRTPLPYVDVNGAQIVPVAYQQILKGMPAIDYSATDLLYRPRNRRVHRAYGYSPVEQIIVTVNIALQRQSFLLDYYREGSVPDAIIGVPETWTPDQISTWQTYWDGLFVDNLAARRRAKFVPGAMKNSVYQTKEPELKNEFDNWLATIACYAFSVSQQAFQRMMNRATAGVAKATAEEEGLLPIMGWFKTLMDDLLLYEFNSPDLEFDWQQDEDVDQNEQATILTEYLKAGVKTINQVRQELGDDPDPNPAANQLMVLTPTGYVPIDANTLEGKKALQEAGLTPPPVDPNAPKFGGAQTPGKSGTLTNGPAKPVAKPPAKVGKAAGGSSLYVMRPIVNAAPIIAWAKAQGFKTTLPAEDLHVTLAYSREPFDHSDMEPDPTHLVASGGERSLAAFGDKGTAAVLRFEAQPLDERWQEFRDAGASWDHDGFKPHMTISYDAANVDFSKVKPYDGPLVFGPEQFAPLDEDWKTGVKEAVANGEVGKYANAPFRALPALSLDRAALAIPGVDMLAAWRSTFTAQRSRVAHLAATLSKADDPPPDDGDGVDWRAEAAEAIEQLDLDLSDAVQAAIVRSMARAAEDSAGRVYGQIVGVMLGDVNDGAAPGPAALGDDIFGKINARAVEWAGEHAGELVSGVNATTRAAVQDAIETGLGAGDSYIDLAARISALGAFSDDRATLIADTETANANSMGALQGLFQAQQRGVAVKKGWLTAGGLERICGPCRSNGAAGAVELDAPFPSGDMAPTAHPNCRCALIPMVQN